MTQRIQHTSFTRFRQLGAWVSLALVIISLVGIGLKGLNLGLDFTGGFVSEFSTESAFQVDEMKRKLTPYLTENFRVVESEAGHHWTIHYESTNANSSGNWLKDFGQQEQINLTPLDSEFLGSQIGAEMLDQGGLAILVALLIILVYLSIRFEWRLAFGAICALFHDLIIIVGLFAWLQLEVNLTILASLLATIGYSLNDSIVVGDRLRELMMTSKLALSDTINNAIKATIGRTLITSGTTLVTVSAIWLLAGPSLQGFAIAMFSGVVFGSMSSVFVALTLPEFVGLDSNHYQQQALDETAPEEHYHFNN